MNGVSNKYWQGDLGNLVYLCRCELLNCESRILKRRRSKKVKSAPRKRSCWQQDVRGMQTFETDGNLTRRQRLDDDKHYHTGEWTECSSRTCPTNRTVAGDDSEHVCSSLSLGQLIKHTLSTTWTGTHVDDDAGSWCHCTFVISRIESGSNTSGDQTISMYITHAAIFKHKLLLHILYLCKAWPEEKTLSHNHLASSDTWIIPCEIIQYSMCFISFCLINFVGKILAFHPASPPAIPSKPTNPTHPN